MSFSSRYEAHHKGETMLYSLTTLALRPNTLGTVMLDCRTP